ncbi:proton-conducting transporter transmembrane domain-containing protein [Varunaivibrio sulfuroxidans]|uniref:Formate hydrogenlyase subunit 3/multisubunit Na+/H+ antiporter MnhD subunit n=1 Tax=Varunaivibrio sulfuroxidans TaxID=1773489 RepID=A0A4V2UNR5_9PROT|nr:proton-conducting transporter membrane subunit [Varunaivibrio sulfuroxidans]TCS63081.1 formate hydrogenlyase subunit 3/multisubunit Na+/H+ antiporter MnhD subunit [Varunaivibrio sulfuroxidans]WES31847.1 proton-conducting transporter membrane subunit [Varunaivibrio sulfuroxidans]
MSNELVLVAPLTWGVAALLALVGWRIAFARILLAVGGLSLLAAIVMRLPGGMSAVRTPLGFDGAVFQLTPDALWLMGFGLPGAVLAGWLGTTARRQRMWIVGVALSLIGALGVFGLQDAVSFVIAWEIMSLGGAIMILGEHLHAETGRPVLFMLALLEVGAVAMILAFVMISAQGGDISLFDFAAQMKAMPRTEQLFVGLLLLFGFGAKLGMLPFYEWFPGAYGAGSGASGAILSGVVLNAAFFGLSRGVVSWLPVGAAFAVSLPGIFLVAIAVISAILAALYAFQQEDWRRLLSFSSAENGSIAICLLGVSLMFRHDGLTDLAGLAWTVAAIHLAGHALAKGAMFLVADGVYRASGSYRIVGRGFVAKSSFIFGVGAFFAAMSLAAMPPQAGFVSEWFLFQTVFQGFHLTSLASRLTAALAGAGLALTAAIAFATYVKVFGIGLLGHNAQSKYRMPGATSAAVGALGGLVLALAVGMPVWLGGLEKGVTTLFGSDGVSRMREGWLLVPLTSKFAFISPSMLVIAMPLLAIIPLGLLLLSRRRAVRVVPVWYGGTRPDPARAATTTLTFSNALRTFYSFIYQPTVTTEREAAHEGNGQPYFTRRLIFSHDVAPIFGPYLFAPLEKFVVALAARLRVIQSGHLNVYLAMIGLLLLIILLITLL